MLELRNLRIVNEEWFKPCTLDQRETAERLDITDRYLRELDEHCPPRRVSGSGQASEYEWPAVMFWFFEFQIARSRNDAWTFQTWSDSCRWRRKIDEVASRVDSLVIEMKKAKISPVIIKRTLRVMEEPPAERYRESV
jgi:hypothetical protein